MAFDISKFMARFVEEAREHVEKLNSGLVHLEKKPDDQETINAIFRSAHTIKGSSRMMKLTSITEVAHKMEDVLGALRDKKINHSKELADLLFKGIDAVTDMIDRTSAGQNIEADYTSLCNELAKAAEGSLPENPPSPSPSPTRGEGNKEGLSPSGEGTTTYSPPLMGGDEGEGDVCGFTNDLISTKDKDMAKEASFKIPPLENGDAGGFSKESLKPAEIKTKTVSETVRVNTEKLDELIKLMGEIVSNQNRMKQKLQDAKEIEWTAKRNLELVQRLKGKSNGGLPEEIVKSAQTLLTLSRQFTSDIRDDNNIHELLTGELQEKALMMRMVPLSTVFDSLQRMVRDIARSMDKDVDFIIEGGSVELDKKMVEKLVDPLIHMLRNSVDHGIEKPQDRIAAGKPAMGKLRLSACYDAGSVVIEISDDGNGIPVEKIKEKALRKKIFAEEGINAMSESALIDLIFQPGFSTSAIITDLSGRGVGMDVVRRNIVEDLRGSITIKTGAGKGTAFYIRLPMTLAVMRVLLLYVSDTPFAVIAYYVSEIIRVRETELINVVNKKAVRLRNEFVPVVRLDDLLHLPGREKTDKKDLLIIIVSVGSERLGLIVDSLLDEEDMVIKSLPEHMKKIQLISGVTISGKGEIINLLHVPVIIETAKEMKGERSFDKIAGEEKGAINILIVDDSINTREIEQSILEAYGYRVDVAGDGMEAVEKTKGFKYDLIITDIEMPRLDGFSLTERLRADESYKNTPIIIVTSREKEEDKRRGITVGADAYIVKGSFDQTNLLETVRNLVG